LCQGGGRRPSSPADRQVSPTGVSRREAKFQLRAPKRRLYFPSAVAENQPANKHRMNTELSSFAARLRERISVPAEVTRLKPNQNLSEPPHVGCYEELESLVLELFALQFKHNSAYRKICDARQCTPQTVMDWTQIPTVPTAAFKELELSCLPPAERIAVFHSSGTTELKPSRHFHCAESLAVYEMSLWTWFEPRLGDNLKSQISNLKLLCLTPPPAQAPRSSLVHMFDVIRQKLGQPESVFVGRIGADGAWTLDFAAALAALTASRITHHASLVLGTAFSFVHLLDFLAEKKISLALPPGSRVMETGGYKNRSRILPKAELHALITERLGVPRENILCEYGMSELSSQAYDLGAPASLPASSPRHESPAGMLAPPGFHFPPWARVRIISPETGREVADGETGLIRLFDLANVFSVAAIQTEDLGLRRGDGFELLGRAQLAEPRGCSLMSA
jgi:hypothetical protein